MIHQFTHANAQEKLFRDLKASLEKHLDTLRRRNDGSLDPIETASLRGEIKNTQQLLNAMGTADKAK